MWKWIVGVAAIVALSALFGYSLGRAATRPVWLTGSAHVSVVGKQATFQVGDWHYGIHGSIPWYDHQGTFHDGGWPDCLSDETTTARFQAVAQAIDMVGKPVLAVDCR